MYSATLRRAERELLGGLEEDCRRPSAELRHTGVFTVNTRLTPRGYERLRQWLLELGERLEAEDDERGEATVVTIAFHPGQAERSSRRSG